MELYPVQFDSDSVLLYIKNTEHDSEPITVNNGL